MAERCRRLFYTPSAGTSHSPTKPALVSACSITSAFSAFDSFTTYTTESYATTSSSTAVSAASTTVSSFKIRTRMQAPYTHAQFNWSRSLAPLP